MLVNNFKPLLFFGGSGSFKDVSGATVTVANFIQSAYLTYANSHTYQGVVRSFNYASTSGSNNYTNEQSAYAWGV